MYSRMIHWMMFLHGLHSPQKWCLKCASENFIPSHGPRTTHGRPNASAAGRIPIFGSHWHWPVPRGHGMNRRGSRENRVNSYVSFKVFDGIWISTGSTYLRISLSYLESNIVLAARMGQYHKIVRKKAPRGKIVYTTLYPNIAKQIQWLTLNSTENLRLVRPDSLTHAQVAHLCRWFFHHSLNTPWPNSEFSHCLMNREVPPWFNPFDNSYEIWRAGRVSNVSKNRNLQDAYQLDNLDISW